MAFDVTVAVYVCCFVFKPRELSLLETIVTFASSLFTSFSMPPSYTSPVLDNMRVMVIVWRLRGNIIRTALCWVVWHNVHSQQHTYMSSSYRSSRLGLSHWDLMLCVEAVA